MNTVRATGKVENGELILNEQPNNTQHTWRAIYAKADNGTEGVTILDGEGTAIARMANRNGLAFQREWGDRVAACVNLLAGIPTETIERVATYEDNRGTALRSLAAYVRLAHLETWPQWMQQETDYGAEFDRLTTPDADSIAKARKELGL